MADNSVITVGPFGGKGGTPFDDGVHTAVKQVIIFASAAIESIRIEYDENGQSKWSDTHGRENVGTQNIVKFDYPNEFLVSASGQYSATNGIITVRALILKSNKTTYGPFGSQGKDHFELSASEGHMIIGFLGSAGYHLDSVGAYLGPISISSQNWVNSLGPFGGLGGIPWNDGAHTAIKQIVIYASSWVIESIQIEYDENGQSQWSDTHGRLSGTRHAVQLDYPKEFLISIEGHHATDYCNETVIIHSLTLVSNTKRYGPYGRATGSSFKFPLDNDNKIIGFHGRSHKHLDSIGLHVTPIKSPFSHNNATSSVMSAGPVGGNGGGSWDDGPYTGVKQLIIFSTDVIQSIQIEYVKEGHILPSNTYGTKQTGTRTIVKLDYPNELMLNVSGCTGTDASGIKVIRSLSIKTNIKTYGPFGSTSVHESFKFPSTDTATIIGFHGRSGDLLDALGVYYKPRVVYSYPGTISN